ncbi:MAG: hypothetical protein P8Z75_15375 [Gammaproteobacteria bacterium]
MKRLLPLLGMLFLTGCGPRVQMSTPMHSDMQSAGDIQIHVQNPDDHAGTPQVRLFPLYQPLEARDLSKNLKRVKAGEYTLTLPKLPPNQYRIVMKIPYTLKFAGIPIGWSNYLAISDFQIRQDLPASCFRFDDKQKDVMDWTSHGVYLDHREKPVSKETCPGLFYTNSSWPYPLNDTGGHGGSLFVPVSSECFPKSSPQSSRPGLWTFSLVSPDLQKRVDWQHLQAIRFHMATRSINVSVKPEIVYTLGKTRHSSLEDVESIARYDVNGGRWNDFEYSFKIPDQATISHVIFHVYGVPEKTVGENVDSIYLDAVCPVK